MSEQPLDIAVVIEHANRRGGQERVAIELIRVWSRRHKVTVYCYEAARDALGEGVEVALVRPQSRSKMVGAIMFPRLAARRLRKGHDVVLAQGGNCLAANFSLFHTCHPLRLETMLKVAAERGRPLSVKERLNVAVRRRFFIPRERRMLELCRGRAYAVSSRLRDDLIRVHGLGPENVLVAPNGVDLATFSPAAQAARGRVRHDLGIADDELVALFVGGIWWEKGLHVALRAVAQAKAPWRLVVVGQDDDAESFERRARDLGVDGRTQFVGRTQQPQDYYGSADCLILPSRFEGFPLVSLEAAACGLPVLISREGHPGDLIDEETGYVLEREPGQFAGALDELAADPVRRCAMGAAAAERARAFTWERQAQTLEEGFLQYARERRAG